MIKDYTCGACVYMKHKVESSGSGICYSLPPKPNVKDDYRRKGDRPTVWENEHACSLYEKRFVEDGT